MAVATDAYPAPRERGASAGAGVATGAAAFSAPFSRVWAARIRNGVNNTFSLIKSPAMVGPAVVGDLVFSLQGATAGGKKTSWLLGYSETDFVEQEFALTRPAFPGPLIFDTRDVDDATPQMTIAQGTSVGFFPGSGATQPIPLNYIVTAPSFYLYAMFAPAAASASQLIELMVTIQNQVSPEALASFR